MTLHKRGRLSNAPKPVRINGEAWVRTDFEPKDDPTSDFVVDLLSAVGLPGVIQAASTVKLIRCLSDVLMAVRVSETGLICWPFAPARFTGGPYGRDIAVKVRQALIDTGRLVAVVPASRGQSAVYKADKALCPAWLRFSEHGIGHVIEVRGEKPRLGHARGKQKGKIIPLSRFAGSYEALDNDMRQILGVMARHPLVAPDGRQWSSAKRIFNNGSLTCGGRIYGDWQKLFSDIEHEGSATSQMTSWGKRRSGVARP